MRVSSILLRRFIDPLLLVFCLCLVPIVSPAQSIDISSPLPVRTNELVGTIASRDLGDSRLTDHFYAFTGIPGDVLITVQGKNLNGDVDVFTAGNLRPLLKFTLYAESSSPITKSIYLRRRQDLILRVEARTPNDDEGSYQIRFGGSFEPIAGEPLVAEAETPSNDSASARAATRRKNSRRVSSVGARIDEPTPPEEVAATPTPEPTPADEPVATATPEPTVEAEKPPPTPRRRGRAPSGRRRAPSTPAKQPDEKVVSDTENKEAEANKELAAAKESEAKPAPTPRRRGRRGAATSAPQPPAEPEPQTGPRLIIEMQDGTRVERFMSAIRRVTVENNQIVVVGKEGKVERIRMAEVIRMAIEP